MPRFLSLLFLPHEKNNHRALLLQPSFLAILIAVYLLNQSFIKSLAIIKPGVLGYSSEITAQKVIDMTNAERAKLNLPPLTYSSVLSKSAAAKAQDMFENNYWAHTSPSGKTPWDFFKSAGYQYSVAGENLAKDFYDTDSMMKAWMNSPTHRANIINSKYREIGIGVVNGVLGGVKTTLVVQHFGTPLNADVLSSNQQPPLEMAAPQAVANSQPLVSPLSLSKLLGGFMFLLIIFTLVVDGISTLRTKNHRLSGSNTGHIGFLLIILMFMIMSRAGSIF